MKDGVWVLGTSTPGPISGHSEMCLSPRAGAAEGHIQSEFDSAGEM